MLFEPENWALIVKDIFSTFGSCVCTASSLQKTHWFTFLFITKVDLVMFQRFLKATGRFPLLAGKSSDSTVSPKLSKLVCQSTLTKHSSLTSFLKERGNMSQESPYIALKLQENMLLLGPHGKRLIFTQRMLDTCSLKPDRKKNKDSFFSSLQQLWP